ncbi:MAG: hypothetical protein AAF292_12220 [Pseudomonadota bacterium]
MNTFSKCLGASCLAFALLGSASAGGDDDFEVAYTYNKYAPADEIYQGFEDTTKRVCRARSHGLMGIAKFETQKRCEAELMDRVVMKMNSPEMVALHRAETGRELDAVNLARRNDEPLSSAH